MENINKSIQDEINNRKINILKGFHDFDEYFEKAKAQIGEVRQWADGTYKKISEGEWVKISETKQGTKEKIVAQSGMKKIIESEREKVYKEKQTIISDFRKEWEQLNGDIKNAIVEKVKFGRDLNEYLKNREDLFQPLDSKIEDLRSELQDVLNLNEIKAKEKREQESGKKEVGINDEPFFSIRKATHDIFAEIQKIPSHITAEEALGKEITADNYWLNSDTLFQKVFDYSDSEKDRQDEEGNWIDPIKEKWEELQKQNPEWKLTHSPKSSSQYLVDKKNDRVYRMADHWGRCASCHWDFGGNSSYGIGVSEFKDFTRNYGMGWVNPEIKPAIITGCKSSFKILKKLLNDDKIYLDSKVTDSIKNIVKKWENELTRSARLDIKEIEKIKKQYKELFEL